MKSKVLSGLALLLTIVSICSCKQASYLKADRAFVLTSVKGGGGSISLHSDASGYEISHSPEWVESSLSDSTLIYNVLPNNAQKFREDSIVVSCGGRSLGIPVKQTYVCTILTSRQGSLKFGKLGGEQTIDIQTDGFDVIVEVPDGFRAVYSEGKLVVEAPANESDTYHANIVLRSDGKMLRIPVTVEGDYCSECGGSGKVTCPKCNGEGVIHIKDDKVKNCVNCGGSIGRAHYNNFPGTGFVTCPTCKGSGKPQPHKDGQDIS